MPRHASVRAADRRPSAGDITHRSERLRRSADARLRYVQRQRQARDLDVAAALVALLDTIFVSDTKCPSTAERASGEHLRDDGPANQAGESSVLRMSFVRDEAENRIER